MPVYEVIGTSGYEYGNVIYAPGSCFVAKDKPRNSLGQLRRVFGNADAFTESALGNGNHPVYGSPARISAVQDIDGCRLRRWEYHLDRNQTVVIFAFVDTAEARYGEFVKRHRAGRPSPGRQLADDLLSRAEEADVASGARPAYVRDGLIAAYDKLSADKSKAPDHSEEIERLSTLVEQYRDREKNLQTMIQRLRTSIRSLQDTLGYVQEERKPRLIRVRHHSALPSALSAVLDKALHTFAKTDPATLGDVNDAMPIAKRVPKKKGKSGRTLLSTHQAAAALGTDMDTLREEGTLVYLHADGTLEVDHREDVAEDVAEDDEDAVTALRSRRNRVLVDNEADEEPDEEEIPARVVNRGD